MIHRAMLGSFERFIGILIEHYAGEFPMWLAPTQAILLPIADRHLAYAEQTAAALEDAGLRTEIDRRTESIGKKIAEAETRKIPAMLVVGDREAEQGTVSVRRHGRRDLGSQPLAELTGALLEEARSRSAAPTPDARRAARPASAAVLPSAAVSRPASRSPHRSALHCGGRFQPKMRVPGRLARP